MRMKECRSGDFHPTIFEKDPLCRVKSPDVQLADKVSIFVETFVTPAKAGVQVLDIALDSRLRGNDIYAKLGLEIKFMRFVNTLVSGEITRPTT